VDKIEELIFDERERVKRKEKAERMEIGMAILSFIPVGQIVSKMKLVVDRLKILKTTEKAKGILSNVTDFFNSQIEKNKTSIDQLNNIMIFDLTIEQYLIETFYTNMINFYIQQLRKKHKLHTYDIINISYYTTNTFVKDTITKNNEQLYNLCGSHLVPFEDSQTILNQETIMIEDNEITIYLF
jgi:hypothetical protein